MKKLQSNIIIFAAFIAIVITVILIGAPAVAENKPTELESYEIKLIADPQDGGILSGEGSYYVGDSVILKAVPSDGYSFINWTENGLEISFDEDYSFIASEDRHLVANFEDIKKGIESYKVSSQSGCSGTVTKGRDTNVNSGRYNVPAICFEKYGWAIPVPATLGNLITSTSNDYDSPFLPLFRHGGVDLVGPTSNPYSNDTEVRAIGDGVIRRIVRYDTYTNNISLIVIQHTAANGNEFLAYYGHTYASSNLSDQQPNNRVNKNDVIGKLRLSGDSVHLHFEVNTTLNPRNPDGSICWWWGPIDEFPDGTKRTGVQNPLQFLIDNPGDSQQPSDPTITSVTPNSGTRGQRLSVTIMGTNFTGATAVSFGNGITVNNFTVNSATQITANIRISANAATRARTVSVTTPAGTGTLSSGFNVNAADRPTVTSVTPNSGTRGQRFSVTIRGTNFTGATAVSFGNGITVNNFTVNSATRITAKIRINANAATRARTVSVTTPAGIGTRSNGFTVNAAQNRFTFTSIIPSTVNANTRPYEK